MHSFKNFISFSSKSERCLHLSTKSSLWINSCWQLRNKARKQDLMEKSRRSSSYDRLFYKPKPMSQRSYSRTWLNKIDSATESMIAQHKERSQHRPIYKNIPKYEPDCTDYEPQGSGTHGIRPVKSPAAKDKGSLKTYKPAEDHSIPTYSTARKIQPELRKICPRGSCGINAMKKMRMPLSLYMGRKIDPLIKIRSKRYSHKNNYSDICPSSFSLDRSTF